jgi:hypothetical protein
MWYPARPVKKGPEKVAPWVRASRSPSGSLEREERFFYALLRGLRGSRWV